MEKKIKILLSLLLVTLLAVACSKKKSDNSGMLALLLMGGDSSSSDSSAAKAQSVDVSSAFPADLQEVIAYKLKSSSSSNLVAQAAAPTDWKRLKAQGTVDLKKDQEIEFSIVPSSGDIGTDVVPIGVFKKEDDNSGVKVALTSLTSKDTANKKMTVKQSMAFVSIAQTVKKVTAGKTDADLTTALDQVKKLLKATKPKVGTIVAEVEKVTGDDDAALQKALEDASTALKTEVIAKADDIKDDAAIKGALDTAADATKTAASTIVTAVKAAEANKSAGTKPATGDKPTATLTVTNAETTNATTSLNTIVGTPAANGSQTVALTLASNKDDAVFFLYTATEQGTKSILLTDANAKSVTPVKKTEKSITEYMNFTSSYVYTLAACPAGTEVAGISNEKCGYSTARKVNWKPTAVITGVTPTAGEEQDAIVKLNLAATYSEALGQAGLLGLGYELVNITISQKLAHITGPGTLTVTAGGSAQSTLVPTEDGGSTISLSGATPEVTIKYIKTAAITGTESGKTSQTVIGNNVSGTIVITACRDGNTDCVANEVAITSARL